MRIKDGVYKSLSVVPGTEEAAGTAYFIIAILSFFLVINISIISVNSSSNHVPDQHGDASTSHAFSACFVCKIRELV